MSKEKLVEYDMGYSEVKLDKTLEDKSLKNPIQILFKDPNKKKKS